MLKLADNPPVLFPAVGSVRELSGTWWVAHTKSRNEKAFAWDMLSRQIPYYLPMIRRTIFSGGRRRAGLVPLFPSYVFLSGDEHARYAALKTDRVCTVIEVPDQRQILDELAAIERVLFGEAQLDPCPFAIVGNRVRIARGPFRGIVGRVVRRDNVTRLVLEISILGRGAEMDIDADLLEAVE
jgi:transcription termination/antitermination protein NusG